MLVIILEMSFKFNFGSPSPANEPDEETDTTDNSSQNSTEIHVCATKHHTLNNGAVLSLLISDIDLRYLSPTSVEDQVRSSEQCSDISKLVVSSMIYVFGHSLI